MCQKCSSKKFLLQSQSSKPLRVCDGCYNVLTATPNPGVESQIQGNEVLSSSLSKPAHHVSTPERVPSSTEQPLIQKESSKPDLGEIKRERRELENKEFVDFNNKHLSIIREESIEERSTTPTTPPSTPVTSYPKPLPLHPIPIEIDAKPPVKKLFSVDIVDDEQLKKTLDEMPPAPIEEPKFEIKPRNPQLYQLCQMNSNSSFWWDVSGDESNDDFGLNFRSDGVPLNPTFLTTPEHPQLVASESVTSYHFEEKGNSLNMILLST